MLCKDPKASIAALRRQVVGLPRNTVTAYVRRWRRVHERRKRHRRQRTTWLIPGAVWAIDGTWLDWRVSGAGRRALIVVELHGRQTMSLRSVPGERASAAMRVLEDLIGRHGAPLVLKLDNGKAFTAKCFAEFCGRHGITLMHSPVRCPSWNGTCEVSGRWAKGRAMTAARRRGADGELTQQDLDAAVTCSGPLPPVDDALRARFRLAYEEQLVAVSRERGLVLDAHTKDHVRRSLGRVAARRALQLCHIPLSSEPSCFEQRRRSRRSGECCRCARRCVPRSRGCVAPTSGASVTSRQIVTPSSCRRRGRR